jgi:predicted CXXCH cytochrome family protein
MKRLRLAGLVVFGLGLLALAPAADPPPVQLVSPPANAVLATAPFYVITTGAAADLIVDGRPHAWGPFAAPVHAARLKLPPGRHEIRIGTQAVTVSIQHGPGPAPGASARMHPVGIGPAGCGACHETSRQNMQTVVGSLRSYAACLDCHKPAQFEAKHAHPLEPLKHCGACHAPHGSPFRGLLKAPVKKLCAACHES